MTHDAADKQNSTSAHQQKMTHPCVNETECSFANDIQSICCCSRSNMGGSTVDVYVISLHSADVWPERACEGWAWLTQKLAICPLYQSKRQH
jgi:hypothetical protein